MNDDINKVGELSINENKLIILVETFIIKKNVMRNPTRGIYINILPLINPNL